MLPMKFCRWTLFEAGRALFLKNWKKYSRKTWFLILKHGFDGKGRTLTHLVAFEEHMADKVSRKTVAKLLLTALYRLQFSAFLYMRRINYDSATVNISVFIEQRKISFQNDISLKTTRLGVLSWEKLKNRETHGRIVSLDQLGSRRAVTDLFVMFIAWTGQKASKVHKILSQSWP